MTHLQMIHSLLELTEFHLSFLLFKVPLRDVLNVLPLALFLLRPLIAELLNLLYTILDVILRFFDLLIGILLHDDVAHAASFGLATSTHGSRFLNKLTLECDHTVPHLTVGNLGCKVYTIADQGILEAKIKGVLKLLICNLDKVIQAL